MKNKEGDIVWAMWSNLQGPGMVVLPGMITGIQSEIARPVKEKVLTREGEKEQTTYAPLDFLQPAPADAEVITTYTINYKSSTQKVYGSLEELKESEQYKHLVKMKIPIEELPHQNVK